MTGFRFVDEHQAEYCVTDLCRVAGVSRSSYYAWRSRPTSARARANEELLVEIREIHEQSRRTYGAPRVRGQLRHRGHRVSRHRVARLMAANGLVGVHGRRKRRKGRHPKMVPAPDLLQRDFTAERSDLRWVADITEFACEDGKLYLAAIRDLHDHSIVGWSMGERQTTDLVVAALVMALGRREPSSHSSITPTTARNTPAWSSRTASPTGSSTGPTAASATAGTTPPWKRSGPRSRRRSTTSGGLSASEPAASSARSCSTTSRSSTTAHATKPASTTAPPPRPTLPGEQPDLLKPRVHEIVATQPRAQGRRNL